MENIVTSKDNPVVKLYQKLSSSKKERLQYGLFVLEGRRIVEDAIAARSVDRLIVTKRAAEQLGERLFQADLRDTRTIVVSNELGNKIASTDATQGVFAICRAPELKSAAELLSGGGKYIVLFGLQDPGNVGMIIRTADALGLDGAILSGSCELFSPKTIRATMGSVFRVDISVENDEDALFGALEAAGVTSSAAVIDKDALSVGDCSFEGAQAIFVGNEGNGLSPMTAARCSRRITIPMNGTVNSLNAAMAAGILMWELKK